MSLPSGAPPPVPSMPAPTATRKVYVTTFVEKGELGIGLDLGKNKAGQGQVLRFKEFPPEVVNPASLCSPSILIGDVIIGVNRIQTVSLSDAVKVIRGAIGTIELTLEREIPL